MMTGNLKYMRAFALAWPAEAFVQQVAAQMPWFHHCVLLDKVNDPIEREWYIHQTVRHGWSRNVLAHQIESGLYHRQGQAVTNFDRTIPAPQSDLASMSATYIAAWWNISAPSCWNLAWGLPV